MEPQTDDLWIELEGELDMAREAELSARLQTAGGAARVVLDFRKVTYIDSRSINLILRLHRELQARAGGVRIHAPSANVRRVLTMLGLAATLQMTE